MARVEMIGIDEGPDEGIGDGVLLGSNHDASAQIPDPPRVAAG